MNGITRTSLLSVLVLGWICSSGACRSADPVSSPGSATSPVVAAMPAPDASPPPSAVATGWDGKGDFELIISEFHFETGTQIVHIDAHGQIDDVLAAFKEVREKKETVLYKFWRQAKYDATTADVEDLRRRLVAASFDKLDKRYTGDNGDDGVTTTYRLTAAGTTYTVSSYGTRTRGEPPKLLEVFRWMRAQQDAHEALRKGAPTLAEADYDKLARAWGVTP